MCVCESWTIEKSDEDPRKVFEMKGLGRIFLVSRAAKWMNEWVLEKAGVHRNLSEALTSRKLTYFGHVLRIGRECLEKEAM